MPEFLYSSSDLICFLFLAGLTTTISICFVFINKHIFFKTLRYKDNTTTSSISALIGIIYGVLVGFVCLYLINNVDHATQATQTEANAASTIYRNSIWLTQPTQKQLQTHLIEYLNTVVNEEWPEMSNFKKVGQKGDFIIADMMNDLKNFQPHTPNEITILNDLLTTSIKNLYDSRHTRIILSYNTLSQELWDVILIGTILIVAINYAFKTNFYLHLFCNILFAIMAGSMLFLIISLDRPFQGQFGLTPYPFQEVIELIGINTNASPQHTS